MKSAYRRHHKFPAADQKMSKRRGLGLWRTRNVRHTEHYRCYTDDGECYLGSRTIFKAKVKANEDI